MTTDRTFTASFDSQADADEHFAALGFVRLPVAGQERRACHTVGDDGTPIIVFASRNRGAAGVEYRFDEIVKRRRVAA